MRDFLVCLVWGSLIGASSNFIMAVIDEKWYQPDLWLFRCRRWEREGQFYRKLRIHRWKDKLPDMSKMFPKYLPTKRVNASMNADQVHKVAEETCKAEACHWGLCTATLSFFFVCEKFMAALTWWLVYSLVFNVPFIIIQRFNRPRLVRLEQRLREEEMSVAK